MINCARALRESAKKRDVLKSGVLGQCRAEDGCAITRASAACPSCMYTEARDTASGTCAVVLARSSFRSACAASSTRSAAQRSGCGARAVLCHAVARATLLFRDSSSQRSDVRLSDSTSMLMLISTADAVRPPLKEMQIRAREVMHVKEAQESSARALGLHCRDLGCTADTLCWLCGY